MVTGAVHHSDLYPTNSEVVDAFRKYVTEYARPIKRHPNHVCSMYSQHDCKANTYGMTVFGPDGERYILVLCEDGHTGIQEVNNGNAR